MTKRYIIGQLVATDADVWRHRWGYLCYLCWRWWRWTTYNSPAEWRHAVFHELIEQSCYL